VVVEQTVVYTPEQLAREGLAAAARQKLWVDQGWPVMPIWAAVAVAVA
jgi:hypothetical protein